MDMSSMDHASMNMAGTATGTASAAMASSTGMSMGMGGSPCKISMLWNWNTIDSCFIARSWHIRSKGMFAGSCIGVVLLVLLLELLRRAAREYDAFIIRSAAKKAPSGGPALVSNTEGSSSHGGSEDGKGPAAAAGIAAGMRAGGVRPTLVQQSLRALLHMLQFTVAYFIMLLAMYYNGYILICIFIGAYLGSFIFGWHSIGGGQVGQSKEITYCCG